MQPNQKQYNQMCSCCYQIFRGLYPTDVFFAPIVPTEVDGEEDLGDQSTNINDLETPIDDGPDCSSADFTANSIDEMAGSSESDDGKPKTELVDSSN